MRFSGRLGVAVAAVVFATVAAPPQAQTEPSRIDIARHSLSMDVWLPLLSELPGTVVLTANYDLRLATWFAVRAGLVMTVPELSAVPFGQAVFLLGARGHYLELGLGAWPWAALAMATVSYRYQAVDRGGPVFRAGFTPGMMFVPIPFVGAGYSFPPRRRGSSRSRPKDPGDGVPLTIESEAEDAAVYSDGQLAGYVRDGHLTITREAGSPVTIQLEKTGYLPGVVRHVVTGPEALSVRMERAPLHLVGIGVEMGSGMMGSLVVRAYLVPSQWFVELGSGLTVASVGPTVVCLPFTLRTAAYLWGEETSPRAYAGVAAIWNQLRFDPSIGLSLVPWAGLRPALDRRLADLAVLLGLDFRVGRNVGLSAEVLLLAGGLLQSSPPRFAQLGLGARYLWERGR